MVLQLKNQCCCAAVKDKRCLRLSNYVLQCCCIAVLQSERKKVGGNRKRVSSRQ
jgi:hypothetical protein